MTRNEIIVSYIPFIEEYIETVDSSLERDDLLAIAYEAIVDAVDTNINSIDNRRIKSTFKSRFSKKLSIESNFENMLMVEAIIDNIDDGFATEAIENVINSLHNKQEEQVIRLRFFEDYTLEEIAKALGVTRERIRQVEAKAIRKLRHPSRSKTVRGYYGIGG